MAPGQQQSATRETTMPPEIKPHNHFLADLETSNPSHLRALMIILHNALPTSSSTHKRETINIPQALTSPVIFTPAQKLRVAKILIEVEDNVLLREMVTWYVGHWDKSDEVVWKSTGVLKGSAGVVARGLDGSREGWDEQRRRWEQFLQVEREIEGEIERERMRMRDGRSSGGDASFARKGNSVYANGENSRTWRHESADQNFATPIRNPTDFSRTPEKRFPRTQQQQLPTRTDYLTTTNLLAPLPPNQGAFHNTQQQSHSPHHLSTRPSPRRNRIPQIPDSEPKELEDSSPLSTLHSSAFKPTPTRRQATMHDGFRRSPSSFRYQGYNYDDDEEEPEEDEEEWKSESEGDDSEDGDYTSGGGEGVGGGEESPASPDEDEHTPKAGERVRRSSVKIEETVSDSEFEDTNRAVLMRGRRRISASQVSKTRVRQAVGHEEEMGMARGRPRRISCVSRSGTMERNDSKSATRSRFSERTTKNLTMREETPALVASRRVSAFTNSGAKEFPMSISVRGSKSRLVEIEKSAELEETPTLTRNAKGRASSAKEERPAGLEDTTTMLSRKVKGTPTKRVPAPEAELRRSPRTSKELGIQVLAEKSTPIYSRKSMAKCTPVNKLTPTSSKKPVAETPASNSSRKAKSKAKATPTKATPTSTSIPVRTATIRKSPRQFQTSPNKLAPQPTAKTSPQRGRKRKSSIRENDTKSTPSSTVKHSNPQNATPRSAGNKSGKSVKFEEHGEDDNEDEDEDDEDIKPMKRRKRRRSISADSDDLVNVFQQRVIETMTRTRSGKRLGYDRWEGF